MRVRLRTNTNTHAYIVSEKGAVCDFDVRTRKRPQLDNPRGNTLARARNTRARTHASACVCSYYIVGALC